LADVTQLVIVAEVETHRIHWNLFTDPDVLLYAISDPSLAVAAGICCFAALPDSRESSDDAESDADLPSFSRLIGR
jgi:hypothetical protein